jgi:hypothetical protein
MLAAVTVSATMLVTGLLSGAGAAAARVATQSRPAATANRAGGLSGPAERGKIAGWPGGNAVLYPTAGFFGNPQILAVGLVRPDGSFAVRLPARVPVDLLSKSASQCSTLHSSDPAALDNFTGDNLVFQQGAHIGDTHSGSTLGIASFTHFANGDTRSGFVYTTHATTLTGFCDRTIMVGKKTADFLQKVDLPLHQGWNRVVAVFSVPRPGHIVAHLKLGTGPHEKWYFFVPPTP